MGSRAPVTPSRRSPRATVQTCVVHLIRNSDSGSPPTTTVGPSREVELKPIYTAPTVDAAAQALDTFETEWGATYGAIVELWRRCTGTGSPRSSTSTPGIRKIIYTTNTIESLNYQLRKVTKTTARSPPTTPC